MKTMNRSTYAGLAVCVGATFVLESGMRGAFADSVAPLVAQAAPKQPGNDSATTLKSDKPASGAQKDARPRPIKKQVISKDGTSIAYDQSGEGPVVIVVASALSDRSGAARLAGLMARGFCVINHDRRGRGASGDTAPYAVEREIEDIEALIDASGGSAFLFGSSAGAVLALEAASQLPGKVKKLAVHEPPFIVDDSRPPVPSDFVARVREFASTGRWGEVVEYFMVKAVGVPADAVDKMRKAPMWAGMEKLAHTLVYDGIIMGDTQAGKPLPTNRWSSATMPALVIDGDKSDTFLRNGAQALAGVLPNAQRRTLPGQNHGVVVMAPAALAPVLMEFFSGKSEAR